MNQFPINLKNLSQLKQTCITPFVNSHFSPAFWTDLAISKSMFEIPTLTEIASQLTQIGHPCHKMFRNHTRQHFTHLYQFKYPTTISNTPCIQHLCQNMYIRLQGPRRQIQMGSQAPKRHP